MEGLGSSGGPDPHVLEREKARVFLMLNVYPDNVQLNVIVPLGPERTLTRFEWLVPDPDRPGLAAAPSLNDHIARDPSCRG